MKIKRFIILLVVIFSLVIVCSYAEEQVATGDNNAAMIDGRSVKDIRDFIKKYINQHSGPNRAFDMFDPANGVLRKIVLIGMRDQVGKSGNYFYCRADFKDINTNEDLELDFYVRYLGGLPQITETMIHKVKDKERYTYDADGNRVPVKQ
jgi:hypothetical protein